MSSFLFGYYGLGLRALSAARLGLQVSGDNIANVNTAGYAKRRVDLQTGFPLRVPGGFLDHGVEVSQIRRVADRLLQSNLEREQGALSGSNERLRGLRDVETVFGSLEDNTILSAYSEFANRFTELSGQPESLPLRRAAVAASETLARQIRDAYGQLQRRQQTENQAIGAHVTEVNRLAESLAQLNREIAGAEADGSTATGLRDERERVIERLAELTGGTAVSGGQGRLQFHLPGGPTLVTGDSAVALNTTVDAQGLIQISSSGFDVTARLRGGKLGALLELRDGEIAGRLNDLDRLATDLIERANLLTTGATTVDGSSGVPLFQPDPAPAPGAAAAIAVNPVVISDPRRLAVSASGAAGDGAVALELAALRDTASSGLGGLSPEQFLTELVTALGTRVVQTDTTASVAEGLVESYRAQRDAVSGVSLDEEAVELIRYQRAYESAARFMQVLNEVTEIAVNIGR